MEDKGIPIKKLKHQVVFVKANKEQDKRLRIQFGTPLVCLERFRSDGRNPSVYFESFSHSRIGLTGKEDFKQLLYEMLNNVFHIVPL